MSIDESKRNDIYLPKSFFNIVPSKCSTVFTSLKMFNLTDKSNMSDFEDDVDIISCHLASPRSKPLGEDELPEAIEKLLATCKSNFTEDQMKLVREQLATMTDTFIDLSFPLLGTTAVAHYIDTGTTRPIQIPPWRVAPDRKQIIEEEVTKMLHYRQE